MDNRHIVAVEGRTMSEKVGLLFGIETACFLR